MTLFTIETETLAPVTTILTIAFVANLIPILSKPMSGAAIASLMSKDYQLTKHRILFILNRMEIPNALAISSIALKTISQAQENC